MIEKIIKKVIRYIMYVLSIIVLIIIVCHLVRLVLSLGILFSLSGSSDRALSNAVVLILNLFVLIEFFRGVLSYFEFDRVKLSYITDATLVFVLREIMIAVFYHRLTLNKSITYAVIIVVLMLVRTLSILYPPNLRKHLEKRFN